MSRAIQRVAGRNHEQIGARAEIAMAIVIPVAVWDVGGLQNNRYTQPESIGDGIVIRDTKSVAFGS